MENRKLTRSYILPIVITFGLLAFYFWRAEDRVKKAEMNVPIEASKVVEFSLKKKASLGVTVGNGSVVASADDPAWGGWLTSSKRCRFPFSVAYMIELSGITSSNYRWDANARTLLVELPDVAYSAPNIDGTRAQCDKATGWIVTDGASDRLRLLISRRADAAARAEAEKPQNLQKARADAKEAVETLLRAPLSAAGLGSVSITVRFPFERSGAIGERWDESTPLDAIIGARTPAR
jgi:hypothetical protein